VPSGIVNIPSRESSPERNVILVSFTGSVAYKETFFEFSSISLGESDVKEGKGNKCHSERSEESKRDSSPIVAQLIGRLCLMNQATTEMWG